MSTGGRSCVRVLISRSLLPVTKRMTVQGELKLRLHASITCYKIRLVLHCSGGDAVISTAQVV